MPYLHERRQEIHERRQEERERRRADILDAAEVVYAQVGWDATTIEQVARVARLSRALVYVYFKDKSDLHLAIVERALSALRARFEQAITRHETGLEKVQEMGRVYLAFCRELPHYFDASTRFEVRQLEGGAAAQSERACVEASQRVHELIVEALRLGVADGSVRSDLGDLLTTAIALWAFTRGTIQLASTKAVHLRALGVDPTRLTDHSLWLLSAALAER